MLECSLLTEHSPSSYWKFLSDIHHQFSIDSKAVYETSNILESLHIRYIGAISLAVASYSQEQLLQHRSYTGYS